MLYFFFFQAEDGIRDLTVTGVQTCALPICLSSLSFDILCLASVDLFHPDQMPDLEEHSTNRRIVLVDDGLLVSAQTQGPERGPMLGGPPDAAANLRDPQPHRLRLRRLFPRHGVPPTLPP